MRGNINSSYLLDGYTYQRLIATDLCLFLVELTTVAKEGFSSGDF